MYLSHAFFYINHFIFLFFYFIIRFGIYICILKHEFDRFGFFLDFNCFNLVVLEYIYIYIFSIYIYIIFNANHEFQ